MSELKRFMIVAPLTSCAPLQSVEGPGYLSGINAGLLIWRSRARDPLEAGSFSEEGGHFTQPFIINLPSSWYA